MPTWEHIEDGASTCTTVWLSRGDETEEWKPLRKADCRALNESRGAPVVIDGGRATVDPKRRVLDYSFYNIPSRQVIPATWFYREENKSNNKEISLVPLLAQDSAKAEALYQKAVAASSSLGEGISKVLKEEVYLENDKDHRVVVSKLGSILSMKKRPPSGLANVFGAITDLQRGYGEYTIEGEAEEYALGPVRHLIFVIHGVGEAMWSRNDVNMPSIVEEVDRTRATLHKKQADDWKSECEKATRSQQPLPPRPDRIELLPIEWYDKIHSSSNAIMKTLKATTLQSIPALRAIANDVVFDVLMYLTPEFCQKVLECVTDQINELYVKFKTIHTHFESQNGKCSLIGHSLGSVIAWDLLSILKERTEAEQREKWESNTSTSVQPLEHLSAFHGVSVAGSSFDNGQSMGYRAYVAKDEHSNVAENGIWGPSLLKKLQKTIPFVPHFTFFLGSPLGLFLTLRGAHVIFDEMRIVLRKAELVALMDKAEEATIPKTPKEIADTKKRDGVENKAKTANVVELVPPPSSPFTLPSGAIFNIFHPSDPVAYRIEPLLLPPDTNESVLPQPVYLVKEGKGVRLHVKAMQMGDDLRRSFAQTHKSVSSLFANVLESAASVIPSSNTNSGQASGRPASSLVHGPHKFKLGGSSDRVDYVLQPGVIDNEYISAVTAHSSYFRNEDVLDFIIQNANMR